MIAVHLLLYAEASSAAKIKSDTQTTALVANRSARQQPLSYASERKDNQIAMGDYMHAHLQGTAARCRVQHRVANPVADATTFRTSISRSLVSLISFSMAMIACRLALISSFFAQELDNVSVAVVLCIDALHDARRRKARGKLSQPQIPRLLSVGPCFRSAGHPQRLATAITRHRCVLLSARGPAYNTSSMVHA